MKIQRLRNVWERLAREDPYWAVLTAPDKQGNRWKLDEFFATGVTEVTASLAEIAEAGLTPAPGRALDFGCGVGRLTQALATTFDEVVGVDVAAEMIVLADRHNRLPERVTYVHNPRSDLRRFADGSFDLVYSLITLQHITPDLTRGYLREFGRLCRPGGVVYFQLPTAVPREPVEAKKLSWWLPTMAVRLRRWTMRWWRKFSGVGDVMRMHALPEAEVRSILTTAGLQVVVARPHAFSSDCESQVYVAVRRC